MSQVEIQVSFPTKKVIQIIVLAWILSLATTLGIVYVAPEIFPRPVTEEMIVDSAIITTKLEDGSVTSAKIQDGTITAVNLEDESIITAKITDGAVTAEKIASGVITTDKIADEAVTLDKIDEEAWIAIATTTVPDNSVNSEKIVDGTIRGDDIADGAIVSLKLYDGSVTSAKIQDGTITAVDLQGDSILTAKIRDGQVTTDKIGTGAVTTDKIAYGAVITDKISNNAVTNIKLSAGAIPFASTFHSETETTTSTTWEDMPYMSVSITLDRTCHLIIMFSTTAQCTASGRMYVRPVVEGIDTSPLWSYHDWNVQKWTSFSYNFISPLILSGGTYTVKMQWSVAPSGSTGNISQSTLIVMALPS